MTRPDILWHGDAEFRDLPPPLGLMRMWLSRRWDASKKSALVCMSNPSQAGGDKNDPTIHNLIALLDPLGYGQFVVVNPVPKVETSPAALNRWLKLVKFEARGGYQDLMAANLALIRERAAAADTAIVAWGNLQVETLLGPVIAALSDDARRPLHCFGLTRGEAPKHPMARGKHRIVPGSPLVEWRPAA